MVAGVAAAYGPRLPMSAEFSTAPRYLPPDTSRTALERERVAGLVVALRRRGVHHGWVAMPPDSAPPEDVEERWRAARPVYVPGVLTPYLEAGAGLVRDSLEMFDRLRRGRRFLPELRDRLLASDETGLQITSSTVDLLDMREIEKVYTDARDGDVLLARDVWAKLSWIADDDTDVSLRIRFSCGVERLEEWVGDNVGALWADRLATAVFPECAIVAEHPDLLAALRALVGGPVRLSERIVYSNAPLGGAVFHHDADPGQRAVVYGQMSGWTAWLALPVRELAAVLVEHAAGTPLAARLASVDDALAALADPDDAELWRLLNFEPAFTARLVARGALYLLRAGDALLLPSHAADVVAWHAVFALGRRPSLGHSYAVFPA